MAVPHDPVTAPTNIASAPKTMPSNSAPTVMPTRFATPIYRTAGRLRLCGEHPNVRRGAGAAADG